MSTVNEQVPNPVTTFNMAAQARRVAASAARRAAVTVEHEEALQPLREVSALLESVWGRTVDGVPLNSDLLRSLVHAGGAVTTARDRDGHLVGTAVLALAAPAGSTYSLIAAAASGSRNRGVGAAVKLAQRSWALERGHQSMVWTFDPLVSRNARFNLAKLGAVATEYEASFYGRMTDAINSSDDSDRLVVRWSLDTRRVIAATEGTAPDPAGPSPDSEALADAPDGAPMLRRDDRGLWCRVPTDVLALRSRSATQAARWRSAVRQALAAAMTDGLSATHMTRDGWYLLTTKEAQR